jgi:hypothetical protein
MRFVEELVSKYDFDALALDYCRFPDQQSDFSDFTRGEFEKYLGKKTVNWPKEIFTYGTGAPDSPMIPGVYYKKWWQFRAGIIRDFIKRIRTAIKELNPDVRLEYWAGSWLSQGSGQNWASPSYNLSADADAGWYYSQWMTAEYSTTGFADLLDTFLLGTYMTNTYMGAGSPDGSYQDPDSPSEPYPQESMEYQIARGQRYVGKACTLYGNVAGTGSAKVVEEQIYYCLKNSAGVMVFDICHFINDEARWAGFKKGIARAEKELAEEAER